MKTTPEQLAELKALVEAATPGPWHTGENGPTTIIYAFDGWAVANAEVFHGRHKNGKEEAKANARLIAASREAIPALLADLEDVRQVLFGQESALQLDLEQQHIQSRRLYAALIAAQGKCDYQQIELKGQQKYILQLEGMLREAQAKLAAAEKDAARYNKLRNSGAVYPKEGLDDSGWFPCCADDVDDYVDNLKA